MTGLLSRVVVPVASADDAADTAAALKRYDAEVGEVTLVYVVEKAGGAPDKAGVEQREEAAREAFDTFDAALPDVTVDREVVYDTDILDGILSVARGVDATAIAFTPRDGGRFVRMLTGDLALRLVTGADRPVVSLPRPADDDESTEEE
ncbi:universal stress protein [Halobaculum gomorrense]|uniref:Universal stress protein family protein n=1 Tax=Halobaculum gomorrense TaxID=43928 RepID=A0A1M5KZP9_9EURY|nr:universal stress protein [Halobaculum gomorrense]SHG58278.1 Universal stress protein family protein [Halobaculum gomorrense]